MVILHIANIDTGVLGGVQVAVPQMIEAQSAYATVGLLNTNGAPVPGITAVPWNGEFSLSVLQPPFDAPDLVVFHELYRPEYLKISRELKSRKLPYVIIPHGGMTKQAQKRKALKKITANMLLFDAFFRGAAAIQYLSSREAESSAFQLKHFIFGNGISIGSVKKETFSGDGVRLLYIGRLEIEIKGLDLLVEAVARSREQMKKANCRLTIHGPDYEGTHDALLRMIRECGVEDLIELKDKVLGEDKENALLEADYFIQTSRSEGMPMGLLEALSYGLPCIVTEGTGLAALISEHHAGYGCPTTVDGICDAIGRALENPAVRQAQSKAAASLAAQRFDRSEIARKTVEAYQQTVKEVRQCF